MNHAAVAPVATGDDPDGDGYVTPSWADPPDRYFHEFQANCAVSRTAGDDPIVYPGRPGASHNHTFMGNTTTDAHSTTASLSAGGTACNAPGDLSGYWMPTLYNGNQPVLPTGPQVIYYKTGVTDYTSVRPFPKGLRFVVGSPTQTAAEFRGHRGWVEGWECGDSFKNVEFPADCPAGTRLNIRMQSPSCWDGRYLDTPDHKAHMAYPVVKPGTNDNVCPADHPVALPMVEFKMAFPVSGDHSPKEVPARTPACAPSSRPPWSRAPSPCSPRARRRPPPVVRRRRRQRHQGGRRLLAPAGRRPRQWRLHRLRHGHRLQEHHAGWRPTATTRPC